MRILMSWVGQTDLKAAVGDETVGLGPIGQAVKARNFDRIVLLCNYPQTQSAGFLPWIAQQTSATVELTQVSLSRPTHFGEIYQAVTKTLAAVLQRFGDEARLTFHLSPGTPAMAAVWILVAKTRHAVVVSILVACIGVKSLKRQARVQVDTGVGQNDHDRVSAAWPAGSKRPRGASEQRRQSSTAHR